MENKVKSFNKIEEIECPHCGETQDYESSDDYDLITYWGEEKVEMECFHCEKTFFIQEMVTRYWESAKKIEDL